VTTLGEDHDLTREIRGTLQILEKEQPKTNAGQTGAVSKGQFVTMDNFSQRGVDFEKQGRYEEEAGVMHR
jgi:hypothetical protein